MVGTAKVYLGVFLTHGARARTVMVGLRRQLHAFLQFLNMAYTFLALKFWEWLECSHNVADGNYYLSSEPSVQCYQFSQAYAWGRVLPGALAALVFYVVGIPCLFAVMLFYIRNNLNGKVRPGRAP